MLLVIEYRHTHKFSDERLGKPRSRWEVNTIMDLNDKDLGQPLMSALIKPVVHKTLKNLSKVVLFANEYTSDCLKNNIKI